MCLSTETELSMCCIPFLIIQAPLASLFNIDHKICFQFGPNFPARTAKPPAKVYFSSQPANSAAHTRTHKQRVSIGNNHTHNHSLAICLARCIKLMTHNLSQCQPHKCIRFRLRLGLAIEAPAMNWPIAYR